VLRCFLGVVEKVLFGPPIVLVVVGAGPGAGDWSQEAYLKAANAERNDSLGYAVSISQDGNTIAGGAADEDCLKPGINIEGCDADMQSDASAGAAYIFVRDNGVWRQQAYIKASNPGENDNFGARLMLSGDGNVLAVGSQLEDGSAKGINGKADDDAEEAARMLRSLGAGAAVVTGGEAAGADQTRCEDVVAFAAAEMEFVETLSASRLTSSSTHGTGCAFSTAIACGLAKGQSVPAAVTAAKAFVRRAIQRAPGLGSGRGPMGLERASERN